MKPSIYPMQSVYCGAKTRNGGKCRNHSMMNGRCRMHGGKAKSGMDHGRYTEGNFTKEAIASRRKFSELMRMSRELLKGINSK
ncbi:MAG: HGGxSTG domain-containing protein [Desulfocapsaceae bacterium]|nr:HGGxSTG domain-containing protein [Desulfocapsaceae bacterium]